MSEHASPGVHVLSTEQTSWTDQLTDEQRIKLAYDWHHSGRPGGDAYVDWLITRGELYTRAYVAAEHARESETHRWNAEEHRRQLAEQRANINDEQLRLAAIVARVERLRNAQRKTLRMDDLLQALDDREQA